MLVLLLVLLSQAEDKHILKWSYERGQKFQFEWTLVFKSETRRGEEINPQADLTTKIKAAGEVVEINLRGEARLKLKITSYSTTGRSTSGSVEMEYADGKIVKAPPGAADGILKQMQMPVELTLNRYGVTAVRWGEQTKPEGIGFAGGRLPESAATVGDSWEDTVAVPTGSGADRIVAIKPKLATWGDQGGRIEAALDEPIEFATGKGKVQFKRTAEFDPKQMLVRRATSELTLELSGSGGKNPLVEFSRWTQSVEVSRQ
jgi:hypothetical protein